MLAAYTHDSTTWSERQGCEARRRALPQRLPRLTRKNSLVVKVYCPPTLKSALKDAAKRVKNCSVNRLVRKAFRSRRFHFPNLPSPEPLEKVTARVTLRLTAEEWQAFKDYAAAWRIPLYRALWLLVARPYTVADRPRSFSHTQGTQRGAQFANYRRSFYAKAGKGCGRLLSPTYHSSVEEEKKKHMYACGSELKPLNGLAEKLWRTYGVKLSVANDLTARYDREEIEAAMELRERRNGAIYNPAGFIVYLLRKGYAQRWAEVKRARQDPAVLAQQVKEAVEAAGFPITIAISDCIPFAEFPNARLALPLDPERAVATLRRIFETERAEPPPSHPFGRAEFVDNAETTTTLLQNANPEALAPAAQPSENCEGETEDADRCRRCGKHNSEIPICDDSGLCLECAGFPTQRVCYDC